MGKTVRRDWLKKQIEKGNIEIKCDQILTDDYAHDDATNCGKTTWAKADIKDFSIHDFSYFTGHANWNDDGTIHWTMLTNHYYTCRLINNPQDLTTRQAGKNLGDKMKVKEMEVGHKFLGPKGKEATILSKGKDFVIVMGESGQKYKVGNDFEPIPNQDIQEQKAIAMTPEPKKELEKVDKGPGVRQRLLETLRKGATRAEINELFKDTAVPKLFNWTLERLEERGITITRPEDKMGIYKATGEYLTKKQAIAKGIVQRLELPKEKREHALKPATIDIKATKKNLRLTKKGAKVVKCAIDKYRKSTIKKKK
jgi:hypothetical protein